MALQKIGPPKRALVIFKWVVIAVAILIWSVFISNILFDHFIRLPGKCQIEANPNVPEGVEAVYYPHDNATNPGLEVSCNYIKTRTAQ